MPGLDMPHNNELGRPCQNPEVGKETVPLQIAGRTITQLNASLYNPPDSLQLENWQAGNVLPAGFLLVVLFNIGGHSGSLKWYCPFYELIPL